MMRHIHCNGFMLLEEFNDTPSIIDAVCVNCGRRVHLKRNEPLGAMLEEALEPTLSGTIFKFKTPSGRDALVVRRGRRWSAVVWGAKDESQQEVPA